MQLFLCHFLTIYSSNHPPIDPIRLVRRLAALENAVQRLKQDCTEIQSQRQTLVMDVLTLEKGNYDRIQEIKNKIRSSPSLYGDDDGAALLAESINRQRQQQQLLFKAE